MRLLIAFSIVVMALAAPNISVEPPGILLNIRYPDDGAEKTNLELDTGSKSSPNVKIKTPVVIIAPKHLVDYQRLYKKIMSKQVQIHADGKDQNKPVEKEVLYDTRVAYADPVSKLQMLYEMLKDAKTKLAFYRADYGHMELLLANKANA